MARHGSCAADGAAAMSGESRRCIISKGRTTRRGLFCRGTAARLRSARGGAGDRANTRWYWYDAHTTKVSTARATSTGYDR
eukprot:3221588-Prymnesium_polylepis.1